MANLANKGSFTVRVGNLKNVGFSDFTGKIAVALFGADGSFKATLSTPQSFTLQSLGYLFDSYKTINNCKLPDGITVAAGDVVRIATQANGDTKWLPVAGELPTTNELDANRTAPVYLSVSLPSVSGATIQGENKVIPGWNYTFSVVPGNPARDVVTVKANGYLIEPNGNNYTIANVCTPQEITVSISDIADVKERRSVWVGTPGTLADVINSDDAAIIKDLTIFGQIDARDFEYIKKAMPLTRLDISSVYIAANGSNQANAMPREALRGMSKLAEVVLPNSLNRINNGAFRQSGLQSIVIPASVATYEYNVFVACSKLRDIWVGRENPEFINWCVLSGVNTGACTLHVPSESAKTKYAAKENWKDIANIVVEKAPAQSDFAFAVMENKDVRYDSTIEGGRFEKGKQVTFKATHIAENDNKMTVYANNTLLTPDAEGNYSVTLNANTIIHFEIETPMAVTDYASPWTLNGNNGSIGLFTDAVNVIPGQEFSIRANAFSVPQYYDQLFWAVALTDANGNIKEFISPATVFTGGVSNNLKMTVNCCVKESTVREGNYIRLVTSVNKKQWSVVKAAGEGIVDALPAINNVTPVYNITVPTLDNATISGVPETAVRGRDLTLKVTPKSSGDRVDLTVNGRKVLTEVVSVDYPFIAMEDMNFDIEVYTPKTMLTVTYDVNPGELHKAVTAQSVRQEVIVTGSAYPSDLSLAFRQDFAAKTIKRLDLSGLTIVDDPNTGDNDANTIPANMIYNSSGVNVVMPVIEEIILPNTVEWITTGAFQNCVNIKEITLPEALSVFSKKVGNSTIYPIGLNAFKGCTSLTTIFLPCTPQTYQDKLIVSHFYPFLWGGVFQYDITDNPTKTTVVVPAEYLSVYQTPNATNYYGNPWKGRGYNILSQYPVYSLNYDVNNIVLTDDQFDSQKAASFLGDNVAIESLTVGDKLRLANPGMNCKVFDNGVEIEVAEDGTIPVTFYNPAKKADLAGNHDITVVPLYDVTIHKSSDLFTVNDLKAESEGESYASVNDNGIKDVTANSTVSFRLDFAAEHDNTLSPRVKKGEEILEPDAEGIYIVTVGSSDIALEIYAMPENGAVLNAEELAAVNPDEAKAITSIGISGEIDEESLRNTINTFSGLNHIDLSAMKNDVPEGIFSGMTDLEGVVLPNVAEIKSNTFDGCSNLSEVTVPETVSAIGDGAFRGCSSLQSLTLTGVDAIGKDAFNGCDNLTSIVLLDDNSESKAAVRGTRTIRKASFHSDAFNGLNPNCLVFVDEHVTRPAAAANYIGITSGIISETQPDGSVLEREGRIYTAMTDINLSASSALKVLHTFKVNEGNSVNLDVEMNDNAINSLVIPFDVASISNGTANLKFSEFPVEKGSLAVATLKEGTDSFETVTELKANVPYLAEPYATGNVIFSAEGPISVSSTPQEVKVSGETFDLNATFASADLSTGNAYQLNDKGRCFELVAAKYDAEDGSESEAVKAAPFSVYATSDSGVPTIDLDIPGMPTSVEEIELNDSISISRDGESIVITSAEARVLKIYNIDGTVEAVLNLNPGRNVIDSLESGVYVIDGLKVRF